MKQHDKADLLEAKLHALMVAGLSGHSSAYQALLTLSAERLRSYFGRRLAGREFDVEDLVQETLIAVHRKRATYDPSLPFTAWLYGIARYRLIDFLRRDKRGVEVPVEDGFDTADTDAFEASLAQIDLDALFADLSPNQVAAIRLTRIDGYSVRETAEMTGQSEPAVKVNVHRGLGKLAARIKGTGDAN
ncbi:sigma-70 family RNA polymerase sigma factor [Sphingomonas daechungensis]|uniref:sigma-70 family RNA polymerase sigma factor n=1 Tax=Sphingomonas daechungensis TaxID=1176646 RepID=UPI003784F4DD